MNAKKLIWLLPTIAVIFTVWILVKFFTAKANLIEISFDDAAGIQSEQTQLRYRGVEIGLVKKVEISEDNKSVKVSVALNEGADHFAVQGSRFWIVRPRMNIQGVSGLETLVEGSYITVDPGSPKGKRTKEFRALAVAPLLYDLDQTVTFKVSSKDAKSLNSGDPVRYRGIKIGVLSKVDLNRHSHQVDMIMNIQRKYRRLIRVDSVFARLNAIDAKMGLLGGEVRIGSFDTLLQGGIELFNKPSVGAMAKPGHSFWLDEQVEEEVRKWSPRVNLY